MFFLLGVLGSKPKGGSQRGDFITDGGSTVVLMESTFHATYWLASLCSGAAAHWSSPSLFESGFNPVSEAVRHEREISNAGKNFILPKEINEKLFFWDTHWLDWSNHLYPAMGPNGGSVAMDSGYQPWDLNQELQEERTHVMIPCEGIEYFIIFLICCVRGKDTPIGHHSKVEPGFASI